MPTSSIAPAPWAQRREDIQGWGERAEVSPLNQREFLLCGAVGRWEHREEEVWPPDYSHTGPSVCGTTHREVVSSVLRGP